MPRRKVTSGPVFRGRRAQASHEQQNQAGPSGSASGSGNGSLSNQIPDDSSEADTMDLEASLNIAAPSPAYRATTPPLLNNGQNATVSFSEGSLELCQQSVRWRNLRDVLEGNMAFIAPPASIQSVGERQRKASGEVKKEEEVDELMEEDEAPIPAGPGSGKILIHTRSLITHINFEIKPPPNKPTPRSLDITRIPDADERNAALKVLQKLKSLGGESQLIKLEGEFGMVMENNMKCLDKNGKAVNGAMGWSPFTGCIGAYTEGAEKISGWKGLFTMHLQNPDEAEAEDSAAHGFKWEGTARRPVNHWFQALAGQVDKKGTVFTTEADVSVGMEEGERVGQVAKYKVSFHTTVRVFTTLDGLLAIGQTIPENEHLRRIVHSLFPSLSPTNQYDPFSPLNLSRPAGADITLSEFYQTLKPAPYPTPEIFDLMQPKQMKAQLKPFQKRTVAWLLGNEKAGGGASGVGEEGDWGC